MPHLYSCYRCHDCQRKKEREKEEREVREDFDAYTCASNEMKNGVREKMKIPPPPLRQFSDTESVFCPNKLIFSTLLLILLRRKKERCSQVAFQKKCDYLLFTPRE